MNTSTQNTNRSYDFFNKKNPHGTGVKVGNTYLTVRNNGTMWGSNGNGEIGLGTDSTKPFSWPQDILAARYGMNSGGQLRSKIEPVKPPSLRLDTLIDYVINDDGTVIKQTISTYDPMCSLYHSEYGLIKDVVPYIMTEYFNKEFLPTYVRCQELDYKVEEFFKYKNNQLKQLTRIKSFLGNKKEPFKIIIEYNKDNKITHIVDNDMEIFFIYDLKGNVRSYIN